MRRSLSILAIFFCLLAFTARARAQDFKVTGPHTYGNLAVYLIHGPSAVKGDYITLEEALAAKNAIVHETGDVNELAIENKSDQTIYVQAGTIVKGGKQDRTLGSDIVLGPKSGKTPIASFCVEHGRWTRRGEENASYFASSEGFVAGKALKLAGNNNYSGASGGQQKVWDEVAANQQKLSKSLGTDVTAGLQSTSSLQLTLEQKAVKAATAKYVEALKDAPAGKDDVIGYAVAINGKLNCADMYGSTELFKKLWPKMLNSAAVEAAAEAKPDAKFEPPAPEQVRVALKEAVSADGKTKKVSDRVTVKTIETPAAVTFDTYDAEAKDAVLHRNLITKD